MLVRSNFSAIPSLLIFCRARAYIITEWYILEPTTRTYDPRISALQLSEIHRESIFSRSAMPRLLLLLYVLHNTLTDAAQVHLYRKVLVSHAHTQKPRRAAYDAGVDVPVPCHARTLWGFAQSHGVAGVVFACKQAHGVKERSILDCSWRRLRHVLGNFTKSDVLLHSCECSDKCSMTSQRVLHHEA